MTNIHKNCALCEEGVDSFEISEGEHVFCCHGCSAVHKILESQNQLEQKKGHPLVLQAIQFGLISNPSVEKFICEGKKPDSIKKWAFEIGGMWCPSCADFIRLVVLQQKGVFKLNIDYITDLASLEYDPKIVSKEKLKQLIHSLSYEIKEFQDPSSNSKSHLLTMQFSVAAFSALNVMMFAYPLYATYFDFENEGMGPLLAWISLGLTIPVMTFSAAPLYKRMIAQGRQGVLGMEALAGIGIISALILSLVEMWNETYHIYFDTITVLITFLLLGKIIESKAKFSTKQALLRLHQALPRKGRKCFPNGISRFVPLKEVEAGDEIMVYSGERIVIDGIIMTGEGAADESVLTGESIPVHKKPGDMVLSGSVLQSGNLRFKVTSVSGNSTLHHILKLVENAVGNKAPYIRSADKIVKWFTPLTLAIAFFTFMGTFLLGSMEEAFSRSMAVLLIACPCAIGIAAPLIESRLIQRFTERGALIQNRSVLANLPEVTHFIFDKTGTITEGQFEVLSSVDDLTPFQKARLKSLTSKSLHPISKAIDRVLNVHSASHAKVTEVSGKGMRGEDPDGVFYLGSKRWMRETGIQFDQDSEHTVVHFAEGDNPVISIVLGDLIKKDVPEMLKKLSPHKRILLSGDHNTAVLPIANQLGFDSWHGEQTPLEKQEFITALKEKGAVVAMIGDGINDAPSLAKADVGISVVTATDISIQVSDLLLTTSSLKGIPELIALAKFGQTLIKQNIFWAFFYNVVGIGLAVLGILTPLFASFAMIMSSLIVLFNAKRIR
jgi:heavy metal translocating P-type ATPase